MSLSEIGIGIRIPSDLSCTWRKLMKQAPDFLHTPENLSYSNFIDFRPNTRVNNPQRIIPFLFEPIVSFYINFIQVGSTQP